MSRRSCLVVLIFLVQAASGTTLLAQSHTVQVQIYDDTALKPGALNSLVARTQNLLVSSGISVQVKVCKSDLESHCETQTGFTILIVRLVARNMQKISNVRQRRLGQSYADHQGGKYAFVFLEQIQDSAAQANVSWITVLAYTIAHEVGHLLLGSESHTGRGLMKANWDQSDYLEMSQGHLYFSNQQSRDLANRFGMLNLPEKGSATTLRTCP